MHIDEDEAAAFVESIWPFVLEASQQGVTDAVQIFEYAIRAHHQYLEDVCVEFSTGTDSGDRVLIHLLQKVSQALRNKPLSSSELASALAQATEMRRQTARTKLPCRSR
jgi:hypothetical protein